MERKQRVRPVFRPLQNKTAQRVLLKLLTNIIENLLSTEKSSSNLPHPPYILIGIK